MKKINYSELLRDPRWQKMRLQILERDGWKCTECGNDKDTLHVHHKYYNYGNKPWEYPEGSLTTLCVICHENETLCLKEAKGMLADEINSCGFGSTHITRLASILYWISTIPREQHNSALNSIEALVIRLGDEVKK